jgi:hypothetical protein
MSVCHTELPDPKLLLESKFFRLLKAIDVEHAARVRAGGCSCGGRLHSATYPRKPRGGSREYLRAEHRRLSFCCNRHGCRKRHKPPSVLYLGRRVYLAAVLVLGSALYSVLSGRAAWQLCDVLGITRCSLDRWRTWWQADLPATPFWKLAQGRLPPPLTGPLPASLLERFQADTPDQRLIQLLGFLAPLSASSEGG